MSNIVRMNHQQTFQELLIYGEVQGHIFIQALGLIHSPLPERASIALHYDVIRVAINTVIIQIWNAWLKTKLLQAGNLSENVVQDTSVIDWLWQEELFDRNWLRLRQIGLTFKHFRIGTFCDLFPIFTVVVEANVE